MPESTALAMHHTGLTVSDLDRSTKFYCDVLGLEVVLRQEKVGGYLAAITGYPEVHVRMAHLKARGSDHRLELFQYLAPHAVRADVAPRNVGAPHVCFVVEDIHAAYRRVLEAGVETVSGPVEVDTGANKGGFGMYIRDPDGITMELFQVPRR